MSYANAVSKLKGKSLYLSNTVELNWSADIESIF